jgi:hypothetical protein
VLLARTIVKYIQLCLFVCSFERERDCERKYDKYNEVVCELAARNGRLDCLKYLRETAKAPWDSWAVREAHENDQPECVQYLLDNNCPLPEGWRYEHGELHVPDYSESDYSESELDFFE